MKKIGLIILLIFTFAQVGFGQTTLSAGDIAIYGVNADNPDDFGFVLLVAVDSGTVIRFTDSGWKSNHTFRGNEGAVKWTAPSALTAGTEITYQGNNSNFTADNDATVGTNGFSLSGSGDQVFAFQGASSSPTFIYAVQTNSNTWQSDATASTNSALPQGLTNGNNAVAVGSGSGAGDEYDNAAYDKSTMSGTKSELLSAISDNSNWGGDNSNRYDFTVYDFTVDDGTPVQLTSFTASAVSGGVMLNWATATEIDNYGFEVECSVDGNVWEAIAFVEGHGNSNTPQEYSYFDNSAAGNVSYRLKQLDNNGAYEYSAVVSANAGLAKTELLQNSPNPFNPSTKINFVLADNGQVNISVYNMLGQKVAELVNGNMTAGNHTVNFNASDLASGFYFYTLKTAGYSKTMKMMLIK